MLLVGIYTLSWMGPESICRRHAFGRLPLGSQEALARGRSGAFQDDKESVEETLLSEAIAFGGGSSLDKI
jgi:hypothetical protein